MARIIDALSQFSDGNGQPLAGGYLNFFENETSIPADTFNDPSESIINPVNVPLDGEGRMAVNAYASVLLTVKLFNSSGSQVDSEDNVTPRGGLTSGNAFANWESALNYKTNISVVTASDGNYYKAKKDSKGVDPVVDFAGDSTTWERVYFNEFFSKDKTYSKGDRVTFLGNLKNYISVSNTNKNNDPSSDDGTNWELDESVLIWVIGKTYGVGEASYSPVDFRRYISQLEQAGNEPSIDDSTNWLPAEGIVDTPTNISPADLAIDVLRIPTLTSSAFSTTGPTDIHEYSLWQISLDSGFTNIIYSSGFQDVDLVSHKADVSLLAATDYHFRVRYKGIGAGLSDYSAGTQFTTTPGLSDHFNIIKDVGSGGVRFISTTVDLLTKSGSIHIRDRVNSTFIKKLDTKRGLLEFDVCENTAETVNVNGLISYAANGFTIGSDPDYNGSTNAVSSYIFRDLPGFHDTVLYTGDGSIRNINHALGVQAGVVIIKTRVFNSASDDYFWFGHKDATGPAETTRLDGFVGTNNGVQVIPSTTIFSLGSQVKTNRAGAIYIAEVFAHNPIQGIFCGFYIGTGSGTNKFVTGFPVGWIMVVPQVNSTGAFIVDIKSGVSDSLRIDITANIGTSDSVQSFDTDGFTLANNALNVVGVRYLFCAIADPDQF